MDDQNGEDQIRRVIPIRVVTGQREKVVPVVKNDRSLFSAPLPLALYIHFPWCIKKCPYCDFNSHDVRAGFLPEKAWLDAVIADLEMALPRIWGRRVQSIFIGGGTPSLMSGKILDELLTAVRMRVMLDPLAEITLEANPGALETGHFKDYRAAGVNRLSLGIQSFNDAMLHSLGRIHDGRAAREAVRLALKVFERVNLDLMYALPGQKIEEACLDLEVALSFGVSHLSCYQLTLEPNTPFAYQPPPDLPDLDFAADMQDAIEVRLAETGFEHYETSAFARKGEQARHNMNYWTFGDYLGIGPGAHSKLSAYDDIVREVRHRHPERYLKGAQEGDFIQEHYPVSADALPFEFMMNALRLNEGFAASLFYERTGLPLNKVDKVLKQASRDGLLQISERWIAPTKKGRRFLNDLLQRFLD